MNADITVTVAEENDAEGIEQVVYKAWLDAYPNEEFGITVDDIEDRFVERLSEKGIEFRKKSIRDHANSETVKVFVAKEGEKVVGMSIANITDTVNQLTAIYVLPEMQGKGIGKLLWEECKKFFDPEKDVVVELLTYNKNAIVFYEKRGFKDTGKRLSYEIYKLKSGAIMPEMEMRLEKAKE